MKSKGRVFLGLIASALALTALAPALASAATILGTVSAEGGGPLQGVEVCPTPQPYTFEVDCVETDAVGHYAVTEIPGGDYTLRFSAWRNNLRYVSEFYDNAHDFADADLLHVNSAQAVTVDVALAEGGSIAGVVTDEGTEAPIAGIWVCAIDHEGIPERCASSGANGAYTLNGLPTGEYDVEFEGTNEVSYLHEFFDDVATWAAATDVPVTVPATTPGIDAEMTPGASISGHVTDPDTGAPSRGVFVCANQQGPGEHQGCEMTDSAGDYTVGSLPAGTYLVAFELEYFPTGLWAKQWWNGAETMADADPIVLVPPEFRTGIDGQATSPYFPQEPTSEPKIMIPPPVTAPRPMAKRPFPKCKKGFHRRLVKGKKRCVRKHQPRHRRHNR